MHSAKVKIPFQSEAWPADFIERTFDEAMIAAQKLVSAVPVATDPDSTFSHVTIYSPGPNKGIVEDCFKIKNDCVDRLDHIAFVNGIVVRMHPGRCDNL